MLKKQILFILLIFLFAAEYSHAQSKVLYKQVDTTKLFLEVYPAKNKATNAASPGIVFFFGGGWTGGTPAQFKPHAEYFSARGIHCFLADYRVAKRNNTTPFEALADAKSAMRFLKSHARDFGLDSSRVIAAGGSAGGHLAAATALITDYDDPSDDLSISPIPAALLLFNPVIDNGPGGYGYERIGDQYKAFSPLHNIREGAPPTIFFLGTQDRLIPVETAKYYQTVMEQVQSRCELYIYEGQGHGFFNYKNISYYKNTVLAADDFLQSLGLLGRTPKVPIN